MTKTELRPLYTEAAARARVSPSESELSVWHSKLGHLDIADLKSAIDLHFDKSHWMPKESELRPLADQAKRGRVVQSNARTTYARWHCPVHPAIIVGGFIDPTDYRPRRCPKVLDGQRNGDGPVICAAKMVQFFREDDFQTGNAKAKDSQPKEYA